MGDRKMRQLFVLVFYSTSMLFFIISVWTSSLLAAIFGMPAYILLLSLVHELGHIVGCALNGNRITGLTVALFSIRGGKFYFNDQLSLCGYCSFIKGKEDALVYISGPLLSMINLIIMAVVLFKRLEHITVFLCLLIAGLHFLKNVLPIGHSDMKQFIREISKRTPVG